MGEEKDISFWCFRNQGLKLSKEMKTISWQAGAEKAGVQIPVLMYSLDPLHLWQHTCENHSESFKRAKGKQSSEELPIA